MRHRDADLSERSVSYETKTIVEQYLLFHYGSDQDLFPYSYGPKNSLHFPIRCVEECLNRDLLSPNASALDIGCAVGRASFELSRYCKRVLAIDLSHAFIRAASRIQQEGKLDYSMIAEGSHRIRRTAFLPKGVFPERIEFVCSDIMEYPFNGKIFDVVLAANILCRIPDPKRFLKLLGGLVSPGGQLILTSPYSWLEEYTPKANWIGGPDQGKCMLDYIHAELKHDFSLLKVFDLPFLLREHLRKYQWVISQASIWQRNEN